MSSQIMLAKEYLVSLKANGDGKDLTNMNLIRDEYHRLNKTENATFSVNVLCLLCRNLEKVPSWASCIDLKTLLILSMECVNGTINVEKAERVKVLACICHIHRYIVRNNASVSPELVLQLSEMPFTTQNLIKEYCKSYWSILADKIQYIEKLKTKYNIIKLLPKYVENVQSVIRIFHLATFCSELLTFVVKKLHSIYKDISTEHLNDAFKKIFATLTEENGAKSFKSLPEKDLLNIFTKFNECFYVIAENSLKVNFRDCSLNDAVKCCLVLVGHRSEMFHCLQTFYLNTVCCILTSKTDLLIEENVLINLKVSCESSEKLGYEKTVTSMYPYLNQMLRLYVEHALTSNKELTKEIQEICMDLMLLFAEKLKNEKSITNCEKCVSKSGLHDVIRLSFLFVNFVNKKSNSHILPKFFTVVLKQYEIIQELNKVGCRNSDNLLLRLQTDVHNCAVALNREQNYEFSIKLFKVNIREELKNMKSDSSLKNISRALFNKSICELASKIYEDALINAFLSMIFAKNSHTQQSTESKYMGLVMDVKIKYSKDMEDRCDEFLMKNILKICENASKSTVYGDMRMFLCNLKYSELLMQEFSMYTKLWPAMLPIAGVWTGLEELLEKKHEYWTKGEKSDVILKTLCEIVMESANKCRSIKNEHFQRVAANLVRHFERSPPQSTFFKVAFACLLSLEAEYDLLRASGKYGWKNIEPGSEVEQLETRTIQHEYEALTRAFQAVHLWNDIVKTSDLNAEVPKKMLNMSLQITQTTSALLLYLRYEAYALQLSHVCSELARLIGDLESQIYNASIIIHHMTHRNEYVTHMFAKSDWKELLQSKGTLETALVFACEVAIYYARIGEKYASAKLVQFVQGRVIHAFEQYPQIILDLAIGRLLEAQHLLTDDTGLSIMSEVNGIQRHYLSMPNCATVWVTHRRRSLLSRWCSSVATTVAVDTARRLLLWRRAQSVALGSQVAGAAFRAATTVCTTNASQTQHAQVALDNHLKYILGLQDTGSQTTLQAETNKLLLCTPKKDYLETMLDCQTFSRAQASPPVICFSIPGFNMPDYLCHGKICQCYSCQSPHLLLLACQTYSLEASVYFRAKEISVAKNYYAGVFKTFQSTKLKFGAYILNLKEKSFENHLLDAVQNYFDDKFNSAYIEMCIEFAFLTLSEGNYGKVDECIDKIHDLVKYTEVDKYLKNDIANLVVATTKIKMQKPKIIINLEDEMNKLKLSPERSNSVSELPKTPENNVTMPKVTTTKKVVNVEELPAPKRRVAKLNLDDEDQELAPQTKNESKKPNFKLPVPVINRPTLELMTPKVNTKFATPKPKQGEKLEFFTPYEDPPEHFKTPSSTMKTYSKKSLQKNIVKKLESEFATPKSDETTEKKTRSRKVEDKRGVDKKVESKTVLEKKVEKTDTATRSRRLRKLD